MNKLRTLFRYLMTPKKFNSRQRIDKIQRKAIKRHIKFVRKNSPFYARHWEGLSDNEWSKFSNLYDLYAKAFTPWEWVKEIFKESKN